MTDQSNPSKFMLGIDDESTGVFSDAVGTLTNCRYGVRENARENAPECGFNVVLKFDLIPDPKSGFHPYDMDDPDQAKRASYDWLSLGDPARLSPSKVLPDDGEIEDVIPPLIESGDIFDPEDPDADFEGDYVVPVVEGAKPWRTCGFKKFLRALQEAAADEKKQLDITMAASSWNGLQIFFGRPCPEDGDPEKIHPLVPVRFIGRDDKAAKVGGSKTTGKTNKGASKGKATSAKSSGGATDNLEAFTALVAAAFELPVESLTADDLRQLASGKGDVFDALGESDYAELVETYGAIKPIQRLKVVNHVREAIDGGNDLFDAWTWDGEALTQ